MPRVSRLLGRVRKVMAVFHRSATAVLTEKQKMLEIASHKLITDVATRWNGSMDMLERYLEHQAAIMATLLSTEVRKYARQLDTLDSNDITDAEEIVNLLKTEKDSTNIANMKTAILQNLSGRYTEVQDNLTALHWIPDFGRCPTYSLNNAKFCEVFLRLMDKSNHLQQVCLSALFENLYICICIFMYFVICACVCN